MPPLVQKLETAQAVLSDLGVVSLQTTTIASSSSSASSNNINNSDNSNSFVSLRVEDEEYEEEENRMSLDPLTPRKARSKLLNVLKVRKGWSVELDGWKFLIFPLLYRANLKRIHFS